MNTKQKAEDLFHQHYMILFDSDSDKGEEILVSVLAIKCAIVTVQEVEKTLYTYGESTYELQNMDSEFRYWENVIKELKLL